MHGVSLPLASVMGPSSSGSDPSGAPVADAAKHRFATLGGPAPA